MKFVHLTDLHLVPFGRRLYGLDPNERLRLAIADINRAHSDADFVLITGDLVHHGELAAYQALKEGLLNLALPYHLLLGNHDNRDIFRQAFPHVPVDQYGFVQKVLDTSEGVFVFLDTNQPGTHAGWLCGDRLTWVDSTLAQYSDRPVYLVLHHPPLPLGIRCMDIIALTQQKALEDILVKHGNVRHMFFGHVHRPIHGTWKGIPFSVHRGLNHQVALTFGEAEGIPGTHEPPAYAVVTVQGTTTIVHVHDFLDVSPRFNLFDAEAEKASDLASVAVELTA